MISMWRIVKIVGCAIAGNDVSGFVDQPVQNPLFPAIIKEYEAVEAGNRGIVIE